ncbi:MAG TPA: TIGR04086 family membrane protein [Bacilli bacterium]
MNTANKVTPAGMNSPLLSGLFFSMLCMIIATVVVSVLLVLTEIKEDSLSIYIYFIHSLCLFIGGFACGKKAESKGWYYGGIMGIVYCAIVIAIGFLAYDATPDSRALLLAALSFLMGAFGGALGVNSRK